MVPTTWKPNHSKNVPISNGCSPNGCHLPRFQMVYWTKNQTFSPFSMVWAFKNLTEKSPIFGCFWISDVWYSDPIVFPVSTFFPEYLTLRGNPSILRYRLAQNLKFSCQFRKTINLNAKQQIFIQTWILLNHVEEAESKESLKKIQSKI